MKILLINPPLSRIIDSSLPKILLEKGDPMPPLGLMYLAGYLEKYTDYQIKILDCQIKKIDYNQLKNFVIQEKPDVVGITTTTFTLLDVIKTAEIVKKTNPEIKIILGGPHVHIYPEETIKIKEIDYCVLGEGEKPLKELLNNIDSPELLHQVKGIVFKYKGKVINTGLRELIQNLDSIPFPARHLTPYKKYGSVLAKRFPVTTMFTSRGCPFKCLFCDRPHLGNIFRARSAKNVVEEMEQCQKMGIKEIFIYDDTFTVNRQRIIDICTEIQKKNLHITWDIRARVDTVDQELLKMMKQAGCQRIHYGVEAGTEKILSILRKGITLKQIRNAFEWSKKIGIETLAYFIIGSPQETREDIEETIKLAKKLKPDYANFSIMTPYPATDIYKLGLKTKVLSHDYWKEFAQNPRSDFIPFFWEEILSQKELIQLVEKAYRSFYLSPGYIIRKILKLRSWSEFKTKAKAGLDVLKI